MKSLEYDRHQTKKWKKKTIEEKTARNRQFLARFYRITPTKQKEIFITARMKLISFLVFCLEDLVRDLLKSCH